MTNRKRVFWASTALFSGLLLAGAASAQSTGTEASEATNLGEVVVTGARGPRNIDGLAVAETIAKTRNTITQEFIATQTPGQTILQTLNVTPGLSFTNTDPYGSSGGNIRLRGFDGARVSLTFEYVTAPNMRPWRRGISNFKDAIAYFMASPSAKPRVVILGKTPG